ncbi:MAG TPA: polyprenol monophosphomannose synthase [Burkholderiales bacterium]|nr:polyprenol monophosphomannose synthase [Burkholderiales bacterium]
MRVLIIVATYNERENIEDLINDIYSFAPEVNILVIENKYKDKLFLMKRKGKLGLGTAYVDGFNWALNNKYDVVMHMDADFSHNPKYIPQFLEAIKTNDLVLGSRYVAGGGVVNWGFIRRAISQGGSLYARTILGIKVRDLTGGFKCWRSKVLESIDINSLKSNGYSFQIETTYKTIRKGFKVKEIPIIFEDRRVGQSKMSSKIFIEALLMVLKLKFL